MLDAAPSPAPFASRIARIDDTLRLVERTMREQLASQIELVAAIGGHVFSSGGKRVRPALLVFAAELCGYTGPRRVPVAAAVELLHTATLLHDDVIDLASERRGRAAANAIWGNRRAVLMGDFLYARASSMIVEDGDPDLLWVFSDTIRRMAEGEILQLQRSFDPAVTESDYYEVIDRKSAVLISAACEAGAILGGVAPGERRRIAEYGREVGLAFQLRDDALDYAGGPALGKAPLADLREGKVTLPLLLSLERCAPAERERAAGLLRDAARRAAEPADLDAGCALSAEGLASIVELVAHERGVEETMRRAQEHVARAAKELSPFPDGPAREALLEAAEFAVARGA
jgi:octaprenyl-diphosphate synthase